MTTRGRSNPDMTRRRWQRAPGGAAALGRHASGAMMALVLLTACGGSSNPVTDTGTPGETMKLVEPETPTDEGPVTPSIHEVRHVNATAEGLRDHWHEAGPIADAPEVDASGNGAQARKAVENRVQSVSADPRNGPSSSTIRLGVPCAPISSHVLVVRGARDEARSVRVLPSPSRIPARPIAARLTNPDSIGTYTVIPNG